MKPMYVCPKCGGMSFEVSAHVVQDWKVNEFGDFVEVMADCSEVTHFPDKEDIWNCNHCGYSAAGQEFFQENALEGTQSKEDN